MHRSDQAPPPEDLVRRPWIASLGSELSATTPAPSWPADEIEAMRRAVDAGVPVLGLCFGGQALSLALGGRVEPADPPEIGWVPVEPGDGLVTAGPWFQWHFEQLTVPPGAEDLGRSAAGPAAFRIGPHLGTQFHPEATPAIACRWTALAGHTVPWLDAGEVVRQSEEVGGDAVRAQAFRLFDAWWAMGAGARSGSGA